MRTVIRADASVATGTGHVMRCLTLAHELRSRGAEVSFVCREQPGDLSELIAAHGFEVTRLLPHVLAAAEARTADAEQTRSAIERGARKTDWLVVDHYALGQSWERQIRPSVGHLMVIDDLANRAHDCDLLLDQNFDNPLHAQYRSRVPEQARLLLGTRYALIRAEFLQHREAALARRNGEVRRILITLGGTDPANDTADALEGIRAGTAGRAAIDVVIGGSNPHGAEIRSRCDSTPDCELHVQTSRMAELMARADLAITGGGSTTWERCILGLPALVTIQSEDQVAVAAALQVTGAQRIVGRSAALSSLDYQSAFSQLTPAAMVQMSQVSARICDGRGAQRVANELLEWGTGLTNA